MNHIQQRGVQIGEGLFLDPIGDAVCRLGDAAGDGGQGVAVAAQGDSVANGVLKVAALQKGDDGLGYSLLAGLVELVARPDLVQGPGQVIAVLLLDVLPDALLAPLRLVADGALIFPVPAAEMVAAHENRVRHSRRALDPLGVVVGHLGRQSGAGSAHCGPHAGPGAEAAVHDPGTGRDPHGRPVSKAVVGLPAVRPQPRPKPAAVACVGIHSAVLLHGIDKSVPRPALHDGLRHSAGHDGIVRKKAVLPEQGKVLRFDVVPLIDRAYDIANNCTDHLCPPFFVAPMRGIFYFRVPNIP